MHVYLDTYLAGTTCMHSYKRLCYLIIYACFPVHSYFHALPVHRIHSVMLLSFITSIK